MTHSTFLSWNEPVLPQAARHLADGRASGGELPLGDVLVVLPGRRAGRRLAELLIDEAGARDLVLTPPRTTTVGALPERLYEPPSPLAGSALSRLVWAEALRSLDPDRRAAVFPDPPDDDDLLRWAGLASVVQRLPEGAERIAAEGQAAGDRTRRVRSALFRAARLGRLCRVRYLSSGAASPSGRVLAPYAMVYSDGRWYALAGTDAQGGGEVRIFRGDRVLDAEVLDEGFEVPDDFDPADHLTEGAPYDPHEPVEARVRYSPRIARWIREKGPVEEREDGSVVVTHSVSDRDWLVRHVLRYGADAEVLGPAELRRLVAREARRVASAGCGSRGIGSEGRSS